jgi:hypothetical protein
MTLDFPMPLRPFHQSFTSIAFFPAWCTFRTSKTVGSSSPKTKPFSTGAQRSNRRLPPRSKRAWPTDSEWTLGSVDKRTSSNWTAVPFTVVHIGSCGDSNNVNIVDLPQLARSRHLPGNRMLDAKLLALEQNGCCSRSALSRV